MPAIVTYEVVEKPLELKKALLDLGYKTMLYHAEKTPEEAIMDVEKVCEELAIGFKRCIASDMIEWFMVADESR